MNDQSRTLEILLKLRDTTRGAWDGVAARAKRAAEVVKNVWGRVRSTLLNVRTAILAIAAGLAFTSVTRGIDDIAKSAQRLNVSVEALSELGFAADLSGVKFEKLRAGLRIFQKQVVEATNGNKNAVETFKAFGISITDAEGKLKTTEQLLNEVADGYRVMDEGQRRAALGMKLFGEESSDVVTLLKDGSAGLKDMRSQAQLFNATITNESAQSIQDFNDAMTRLKTVTGSIFRDTVVAFARDLTPTLNALAIFVAENRPRIVALFIEGAKAAATFAKTVISAVGRIADAINRLVDDPVKTVANALSDAVSVKIDPAVAALRTKVIQAQEEIERLDRMESRIRRIRDVPNAGDLASIENLRKQRDLVEQQLDIWNELIGVRRKAAAEFARNNSPSAQFEDEFAKLLAEFEAGARAPGQGSSPSRFQLPGGFIGPSPGGGLGTGGSRTGLDTFGPLDEEGERLRRIREQQLAYQRAQEDAAKFKDEIQNAKVNQDGLTEAIQRFEARSTQSYQQQSELLRTLSDFSRFALVDVLDLATSKAGQLSSNWKVMANSMIQDLKRIAIQMAVTGLFNWISGGAASAGGGFLNIFGRAAAGAGGSGGGGYGGGSQFLGGGGRDTILAGARLGRGGGPSPQGGGGGITQINNFSLIDGRGVREALTGNEDWAVGALLRALRTNPRVARAVRGG